MSHWVLVTYTRPNTDTPWFNISAEATALIESLKDDDIVNPPIEVYQKAESTNGLKQYFKVAHKDIESAEALLANSVYLANENARNNYLNSTGTTCVIDQFGESEPVINLGLGG